MEAINQSKIADDYKVACSECLYFKNKYVELSCIRDGISFICSDCLLKAYLLINPISFPKKIISPLSLITQDEYKRLIDLNRPTIARQVLQNYDAFIEWLKPFLESK